MPKINFTTKSVRAFPAPEKGRIYVYDSKTPHLALCITAKGTRTYYRIGRIDGAPVRIRLGTVAELDLATARNACMELTGQVASARNPHRERRKAKRTLADAWRHYSEHTLPSKRSADKIRRRWEREFSGIENRTLSGITIEFVQDFIAKVKESNGPQSANDVRVTFSAVFQTAIRLGWVASSPVSHVPSYPKTKRSRYLSREEVGKFFEAVIQLRPLPRDFLLLCLYTGARRGNVAAMRWDAVDIEGAVWRVEGEESKNEETLGIYLSSPAIDILKRRKSTAGDSPYVFATHSASGHYSDPADSWEKVLKLSGLKNLRIHDLRRTMGSWQANANVPLNVIGKSLGHKSLSATAVYAHLQLGPVKDAVDTATKAILEAAQKNPENTLASP